MMPVSDSHIAGIFHWYRCPCGAIALLGPSVFGIGFAASNMLLQFLSRIPALQLLKKRSFVWRF
jgi:hypothetical protein